jgi:glycosyltransferase involved in cell wall biosynthesis
MVDFVAAYQNLGEPTTLLVLTTQPPDPFRQLAASRGVSCRVERASRDQMPGYLSAGDVGLSFILEAPSKTACSPVKNGEYLACGLPVVTTAGIGDYSRMVADRRVGVVVSLAERALEEGARRLRALLSEQGLASRCREAATSHAGLSEVVLPRYRALYRELLGQEGVGA